MKRLFTRHLPLVTCLLLLTMLASCAIEPPLHLPAQNVRVDRQAVEIELETVWENPLWRGEFIYGWEASDIKDYGPVEYEKPIDYELRLYFLGSKANGTHKQVTPAIMREDYFRSMFLYGFHDVLAWSNIYTPDNTQSVVIKETLDEVTASVTYNSGAQQYYAALTPYIGKTAATIYNQPDIFFSAYLRNLEVTPNPEDYDYYDEVNKCWVKKASMPAAPLVYIYLVQVVIRNNDDGKIVGVNNGGAISGLAESTDVNYGNTSDKSGTIYFNMGVTRKKTVDADYLAEHHSGFKSSCTLGETIDVVGGRMTTYGLCSMPDYVQSRTSRYTGKQDEQNIIALDLAFRNGTTKIEMFDITQQMRNTCHGGVVTIEIDASQIAMPDNPNPTPSPGSGFDPWVEDYRDDVIHELDM